MAQGKEKIPFGESFGVAATARLGSVGYIICSNTFIFGWAIAQHFLGTRAFDPYPYILLNLALSWAAAQAQPLILLAANRTERLMRAMLLKIQELMEHHIKMEGHHIHLTEAVKAIIDQQVVTDQDMTREIARLVDEQADMRLRIEYIAELLERTE